MPEHEHPLIRFCQRYGRLFHQDPLLVAQHPDADLPLMNLLYESAAADLGKEGE